MVKYLRSKETGAIFDAHDRLVGRPEFEEVTEEQAFPERFISATALEKKSTIDLTVPEAAAVPPPPTTPELTADASRPFGGVRSTQRTSDNPRIAKAKEEKRSLMERLGRTGER